MAARVKPGLAAPRGLMRLLKMCRAFLSYVERDVFPGGCFFAAAAVEYDARTGAVRDRIAAQQVWWLQTLERLGAEAMAAGELVNEVDPKQLAFELESLMFTASHLHKLEPDLDALDRAEKAVGRQLASVATPVGRRHGGTGVSALAYDFVIADGRVAGAAAALLLDKQGASVLVLKAGELGSGNPSVG